MANIATLLNLPLIEEKPCPGCGEWSPSYLGRIKKPSGLSREGYFHCPSCGIWRKKNKSAAELGRLGGLARARALTSERRQEIAKLARLVGIEKAHKNKTRKERSEYSKSRGTHTALEWFTLVKFCGEKCVACGGSSGRLTKDHVIPVVFGGSDRIDNLQPLCSSCNSAKQMKAIDYRPSGWWNAFV